jgi:hypothetical protein
MQYIESLTQSFNSTTDPFVIRACAEQLALECKEGGACEVPRGATALKKIEAAARAMSGVCALDVDNAWADAVAATPKGERKSFAAIEQEWKESYWARKTEEAHRHIASLRTLT